MIDLLHQLNDTGCCEFLCEPYSHGLSSLANEECFREEVSRMSAKIKQVFGQTPKVFRNSSLIYSNEIGSVVASMGFKGILTEGAKHVLGWKSPHYVYHCAYNPNLKILLRDFKLSDDISLRFSNSIGANIRYLQINISVGLRGYRKKNRLSIFLWSFLPWVLHNRCLRISCSS